MMVKATLLLVLFSFVCLSVINQAAQKNDDTKADPGAELCKKLGFSEPIKSADVQDCNVVCTSKNLKLTQHLERDTKCIWEGKENSSCRLGECYDNEFEFEFDEEDYAVVEIYPMKYELHEGKLEKEIEFDAFVANLPRETLTYQLDYVFCSCPAGNRAKAQTVTFNSVCKTRLLHVKAKLGFAISNSTGTELDSTRMALKIGKLLDTGPFRILGRRGTFTLELKTGKRKIPPKEESVTTTTSTTRKPQGSETTTKKPTGGSKMTTKRPLTMKRKNPKRSEEQMMKTRRNKRRTTKSPNKEDYSHD